MTVKVTQLTKGSYIRYKNDPQQVLGTSFHHPGRGGGVASIKMKNLRAGTTLEETFKSSEQVELIDLESREMQFLYEDGTDLVFMNPRTYEQVMLPTSLLGDKVKLLTSDLKAYVLFDEDKPIAVTLPPKVALEVTEAHDAVAGNTVGGAKKTVVVETGLEVQVPLFIKQGERVVLDVETGQYVSRAT